MPPDRGGCWFYRQEMPSRAAISAGWEVVTDGYYHLATDPHGRVVPVKVEPHRGGVLNRPIEADVVLFCRPAKRRLLDLMRAFQGMGTAVVVDVDDDFTALHTRNPAKPEFDGHVKPGVHKRNVMEACRLADMVTVTTQPLADLYGRHGRVAVLPNCVPKSLLEMPSLLADERRMGWPGLASYHPDDLEACQGGVASALAEMPDWRFRVVGPEREDLGVARRLGLSEVEATGFLELEAYHMNLGALDVGIAPLAHTRFNLSKSSLKVLEQAARGVPTVASDLPEYRALADEGIGVVVDSRGRSWKRELLRLMRDAQLRSDLAESGMVVVRDSHTYETQGWRWLEVWERARENRRRAGRRVAA